ncbi:hypothetical protein [Burkholderia multivorans]|uniref:hypothetical protein n=1 Tax=Burkholderia multivorans TaxID=87883 RepID=UPI001EFA1ECA|nr:hypothetical protein [Burkholderia multivorans]
MTTENSRADALTNKQRAQIEQALRNAKYGPSRLEVVVSILEDVLAASPVSQPAAAPIDKRCVGWAILNGVCVVDFSRDRAEADRTACEMQRSHDLSGSLASFHVEPVFIRTDAAPAPSPADERAAFERHQGYPRPEYDGAAQEAWDYHRKTWLAALAFARASSANETGAEGAEQFEHVDAQNHVLRRALQRVMARLTSLLDEDQFADIESIVKDAGVEPPAQADAREGMTDAVEQLNGLLDACENGSKAERVEARSAIHAFYRRALLAAHPGQPEPRECRHCGWMCIPNSTPSTTHYPLPQPEPSGEVMAFTTTVGRLLATAPHFEECETPEPCLSALIHRYYENYFDREKGREYAELYIAALYEAARAQGGDHE